MIVNNSHPAYLDWFVGAYAPIPNKGMVNINSGQLMTNNAGTGTLQPSYDSDLGYCWSQQTGTFRWTQNALPGGGTNVVIAAAICRPMGLVSAYANIMTCGGGPYMLYFHNMIPVFYLQGGAESSSGITLSVRVPYFVACSMLQVGTTNALCNWVIKRLDTGQVFTASNSTASTATFAGAVFVGSDASSETFNGLLACTMYSTGQMGHMGIPALRQWAEDPWSFWYAPQLDLMKMVSAPPLAPVISGYTPELKTRRVGLGPLGMNAQPRASDPPTVTAAVVTKGGTLPIIGVG